MLRQPDKFIVLETGLLLTGVVAVFLLNDFRFLLISAGGCLVFFGYRFFNRDPEREVPEIEGVILSPADGKVVEINEKKRLPGVPQTLKCVAIFLSLWDVHVNRVPVTGTVETLTYHPGQFHPAFSRKASSLNEHNIIPIRRNDGIFYVKQIAGTVARRIICDIGKGEQVVAGQRLGKIVLGSCVELYLPDHIKLAVRKGQLVVAGQSIIGRNLHEN